MGSKLRNVIRILRGKIEEQHAKIMKKIFDAETDPERIQKMGENYSYILERIRKLSKDELLQVDEKKLNCIDQELGEERLQQSEMSFRDLSNSVVAAIMLYQNDYWIYANPAAEEITGYTFDELKQMKFWEFTAPEYVEVIKERGRARQKGASATSGYEFKIVTKQGEEKWVLLSGNTTELKSGKAGLIMLIDITDRKQAEKELKEKEEKYRSIFEQFQDVYYRADMNGTLVELSPSVKPLTGYEREELIGKPVTTVYSDPADREDFLRELREKGSVENYELTLQKQNGEKVVASINSHIVVGENGEPVGIEGTLRDITEQKQTEEALKESEDRFRKLFNTEPDPVALVDEEGKFLTVNPAMAERFNLTPRELEGKTFQEVMPKDIADRRIEKGRESIEKGETVYFEDERQGIRQENYYVPVSTSGEKRTFQVISRDITKQRQMEEKLKEMSFHDSLTGLYNRNFFEEEMERLGNGRYNPVGIVVCDLDGLKFINDTLGHQSGDRMIIQAADLLRQNFRSSDIIARTGGDEFVILLTEIDSATLEQILQRVDQAIEEYNATGPEIPFSLSIGHALSEQATDMQALFREADDRMYRNKVQCKENVHGL